MRSLVCSLDLHSESLAQARQRADGLGELLGLKPLPRSRWLTAVSGAAREAVQTGGGALTLLLDSDSVDCGGPCLAAEILQPHGTGAFTAKTSNIPDLGDPAGTTEADALARARLLVDHVARQPAPGGGTLLTLEIGLSVDPPAPSDEDFVAGVDALLQAAPPTPLEALAQQDRQLFEALQAADAAQAALAAERTAHGEALALLAHDLRSPLLTLNLSLEMLRVKPHSPAELEQRREVMKRQADLLKAIAAGLLQAPRAQSPAVEDNDGQGTEKP